MTISVFNKIVTSAPDAGGHLHIATLGAVSTFSLVELYEKSTHVAAYLTELGLKQGDTIGILAANCLEWVLLDLAAIRLKVVTAGFDPGKFTVDDDLIANYNLRYLFTDKANTSNVESVLSIKALSDVAEAKAFVLPTVHYSPLDTTTIKFTSGSTGQPKGLAATVASVDASLHAVQKIMSHQPGDNLFVFLPLSLLQQRYWIYSALIFGHDVTVSSYQAAFSALSSVRPTVVMGVPAFFEGVRNYLESQVQEESSAQTIATTAANFFGNKIRYLWTGSAPADAKTLDFFNDAGLPIFEGYGLNETCIVSKNHPGASRKGSVGKILDGKRVTIEDDGAIIVHSDHPVNDKYLYASPEATNHMFLGSGKIRTGDLGYIDADGYLFIRGRADDVIVLGSGKKIDVNPIESRFRESSLISECVIFCPGQTELIAVVSPSASGLTMDAVNSILKSVNQLAERDERVARLVLAPESFSIENGLLTSQFKPIRSAIYKKYDKQINNIQ